MHKMKSEDPKKERQFPIGFYIELKNYDFYLNNFSQDIATLLFTALKEQGLETVEKCQKLGIPIIV